MHQLGHVEAQLKSASIAVFLVGLAGFIQKSFITTIDHLAFSVLLIFTAVEIGALSREESILAAPAEVLMMAVAKISVVLHAISWAMVVKVVLQAGHLCLTYLGFDSFAFFLQSLVSTHKQITIALAIILLTLVLGSARARIVVGKVLISLTKPLRSKVGIWKGGFQEASIAVQKRSFRGNR